MEGVQGSLIGEMGGMGIMGVMRVSAAKRAGVAEEVAEDVGEEVGDQSAFFELIGAAGTDEVGPELEFGMRPECDSLVNLSSICILQPSCNHLTTI
jgi:hypothetical protein